MKATIIAPLIILLLTITHQARAEDFPTGTFVSKPGAQRAPLGQVELAKRDGQYFLRMQMANKWQEVGRVEPMTLSELQGAIGQDPAPVKAHGLRTATVAFVVLEPNTKIRGHTISTGIVLISPALGSGGTAELAKE